MATEYLTTTMAIWNHFHELELCQDEILTILQTLDDNCNNSNIFNLAAGSHPGPPLENKNNCINNRNKRKNRPAKTSSSSSLGIGFDDDSDEGHAMSPKRKCVKMLKVYPPAATSTEDGSGEFGKVVAHIALERNRRKQMNEHLAVLKHLMPSFYVKKGDQASIIGGVIDYINELHQVLRSLESKKQRKFYTSEVSQSPKIIAPSPRLAPVPHQQLNLSPLSPRTPRSTSPFKALIRQPFVQPSSITSPTSNPFYCSDLDMIMMMNKYNNICNNDVANELVASSKSSVAEVNVKFCGPNLELKTLFAKCPGQTLKIVSAIEDLALEILQVGINSVEETTLNVFTIKIGIECQLSAEELVHHIQQTFC